MQFIQQRHAGLADRPDRLARFEHTVAPKAAVRRLNRRSSAWTSKKKVLVDLLERQSHLQPRSYSGQRA